MNTFVLICALLLGIYAILFNHRIAVRWDNLYRNFFRLKKSYILIYRLLCIVVGLFIIVLSILIVLGVIPNGL
jgi:hypothetical protein